MNWEEGVEFFKGAQIDSLCYQVFFFFFKEEFFKIFIYLAAPVLSCGTWDLRSSLQHMGSLIVVCGIQFPDQGSNRGPLHWEHSLSHWTTKENNFLFSLFMVLLTHYPKSTSTLKPDTRGKATSVRRTPSLFQILVLKVN